ncbi:MAG: hypothetical protein H6816_14905, partial [Phycisphaerales bacterium]|nr:hypothetical protein [Phycisphaerales bacterium]
ARPIYLFRPDTDPLDGVDHDNSFLYFAWQLSIRKDGGPFGEPNFAPVPYDADDNGKACFEISPIANSDSGAEGYAIQLQTCANIAEYNPTNSLTNSAHSDNDLRLLMSLDDFHALHLTARGDPNDDFDGDDDVLRADSFAFPTALVPTNGVLPGMLGGPDQELLANPTNGCIDQELTLCAGPDVNSNNVEVVIRHAESKLQFGNSQREARFALAQVVGRYFTRADEDFGDEEFAVTAVRESLPSIEVSKAVRCLDADSSAFAPAIEVVPGAGVEYRITVRNTGNEPLDVTMHDLMQAAGTQSGFVACAPQCGTLSAVLHRGGATVDIDAANAAAFGLSPDFFTDECVASTVGFLNAVRSGAPIFLGTLQGVAVTRVNGACLFQEGDVLELFFEAVPDVTAEFCSAFDAPDCVNSVAVTATFAPPAAFSIGNSCAFNEVCDDGLFCNGVETCGTNGFCIAGTPPCGAANCDEFADTCGLLVVDSADAFTTNGVIAGDGSDNTTQVDILCAQISCDETICADLDTDGLCDVEYAATNSLQLACDANDAFPLGLDYTFFEANGGEVPFAATELCKPGFVAAALAAGISVGPCDLCNGPCDGIDDDCAAPGALGTNGTALAMCHLDIPNRAAWLAFAASDGGDANCHTNGITATGFIDTNGTICTAGADTAVTSTCGADVCIAPPCVLDVEKSFHCVDNCIERNPLDANTNALEALPGATVEFEIIAANTGTNGDPNICSLSFADTVNGPFIPCPDACTIQVINGAGDPVCSLPGDWLPLNGAPVEVDLATACGAVLSPGDHVVLRCAGTIPIGATGTTTNSVTVSGAADCPDTGAVFCCSDSDESLVDIDTCAYTLAKDVTCDDPRAPGAFFEPDLVDALPGSTLGFRIQLTNSGDVNLPALTLTDSLGCSDWFIPGSVVADIDGTPVTDCVCPGGVCSTVADLNGPHDFSSCPPGAVPTNGVLTITFKVKVPDDFATLGTLEDCVNTVTVQPVPDACYDSLNNPCAELTDSARINVDVPDVTCAETVCADLDTDGVCEFADTNALQLACSANDAFPIILDYTFTVTNTGETPLATVDVCKPGFVAQALAAGIEVGPCDLCTGACDAGDDCGVVGPVGTNSFVNATCQLKIPTRSAWLAFAAGDGGDENCHTNSLEVTGNVDTSGYCAEGADTTTTSTCGAEACIAPTCTLEVEKTFRCVDNCVGDNPGVSTNALEVLPGATVEFEIVARNAGLPGDTPICNLEFTDTLAGAYVDCPDECIVQVIDGATNPVCSVPAGFVRIDGVPFALDLAAACGVLLDPGAEVHITCTGTIPDDATGVVTNAIDVRGAPTCPVGAPDYCCTADASALVDIDTCGPRGRQAGDLRCRRIRAPSSTPTWSTPCRVRRSDSPSTCATRATRR